MPTLKEFIRSVLQKENIEGDVDKIAKEIEKEARKQAVHGIACICDEEVREMTINIADLMLKNPDAYKDKPKQEKHVEEAVDEEVKEEPKKVENKVKDKPKEQVKKVKEVKIEEPKETVEDEKPKKIEKGTFGKEMIVINVEQKSLF